MLCGELSRVDSQMPTSLCSNKAMRNSIVVDLAHELADYYMDGRYTSFAGVSASSIPSNLSCDPGVSILHENSDSREQHRTANLCITSQESGGFGKTGQLYTSPLNHISRSPRLQAPSSLPQQDKQQQCHSPSSTSHRLPDNSEESCFVSVDAPRSRDPSDEDEDDATEEEEEEDGESDRSSSSDDEDEESGSEDSDSDEESDSEAAEMGTEGEEDNERSITHSGAETVPWTLPEASHTCVGGGSVCTSASSTSSASSNSSVSSASSAHESSEASFSSTKQTTTALATSRTVGEVNSVSALPTAVLCTSQSIARCSSAGTQRKAGPQPPQDMRRAEATRNEMSMPFLFTRSGSFGAFPSPPDEETVAAEATAAADGEALQQSAVFSDISFSYGGPSEPPSSVPLLRATNPRPSSWRRSLNGSSLLQVSASAMRRQSSAIASMLYSTIDGGAGGAASRPGMEGTFSSSMMYLYSRVPSAVHPRGSGAVGTSARLGSGAFAGALRHRRGSSDSTESDSSGATSSSSSDSDNSNEGHSSFFKRAQNRAKGSRMNSSSAAADAGNGGSKEPESPPHRRLCATASGFSPGLNVRVLRGNFKDGDASLDSRELARAGKKFGVGAAAAPSCAVVSAPGKVHALHSGASTNSPAGITSDSDNANGTSGHHQGANTTNNNNNQAAAAATAAETMRRRPSGNTFINFFRGSSAHPGRSSTSMTMSSGWGATQAPGMSQQTVVGGWRLLSFRVTDDTPLTTTENVPHDKTKKKKSKKAKKSKKEKKKKKKGGKSHKEAEQAEEEEARQAEEQGVHGDVARDVANATMHNDSPDEQPASPREDCQSTQQAKQDEKTQEGKARDDASGSGSCSDVAHGEKAAQGSPATAEAATPPEVKPEAWPIVPSSLPPVTTTTTTTAQNKMLAARLPLRHASLTSTARTMSPMRPTFSDAAEVHRHAHQLQQHNNAKLGGGSGRNRASTFNSPASGPTATAAGRTVAISKKPLERIDKFKEAPMTSPSATVRRTTVRVARKPKVLVNASRRVNLNAIETATTGVRRFRSNAGTRLKGVMPPSNTRTASVSRGSNAAVPEPSLPSERLPPL